VRPFGFLAVVVTLRLTESLEGEDWSVDVSVNELADLTREVVPTDSTADELRLLCLEMVFEVATVG
jgi:hypothetical protein